MVIFLQLSSSIILINWSNFAGRLWMFKCMAQRSCSRMFCLANLSLMSSVVQYIVSMFRILRGWSPFTSSRRSNWLIRCLSLSMIELPGKYEIWYTRHWASLKKRVNIYRLWTGKGTIHDIIYSERDELNIWRHHIYIIGWKHCRQLEKAARPPPWTPGHCATQWCIHNTCIW